MRTLVILLTIISAASAYAETDAKSGAAAAQSSSSFYEKMCAGKPFEAEFVGKISDSEPFRKTDPKKGKLCRFKLKASEMFNPHALCPFTDQSRGEDTWFEEWDHGSGCPQKGDHVSGYFQLMPEGNLKLDDPSWTSASGA